MQSSDTELHRPYIYFLLNFGSVDFRTSSNNKGDEGTDVLDNSFTRFRFHTLLIQTDVQIQTYRTPHDCKR